MSLPDPAVQNFFPSLLALSQNDRIDSGKDLGVDAYLPIFVLKSLVGKYLYIVRRCKARLEG